MENLHIKATKFSLDVRFDAQSGQFEMAGSSYPENALEYFQPIFEWLEQFMADSKKPIHLDLKLEYLNTSSSKCLLDFFKLLEDYHAAGHEVNVRWFYEAEDEDMAETGEEFLEDLELPFELVPQ